MSSLWIMMLGVTGWVGSEYPLPPPSGGNSCQVPGEGIPLSIESPPSGYEPAYRRCPQSNGCGCPFCAARELVYRVGAKKALMGYSNCNCGGSYLFPVPPQATYHWPGMYAQPTMTEYPYWARFPPLKRPEEVFPPPSESPGRSSKQ